MSKRRKKKAGKGWKKVSGMNRHHWLNKCQGGEWTVDNISYLHVERHDWWHRVFGNLSLDEAIAVLTRLRQIKSAQPHLSPSNIPS